MGILGLLLATIIGLVLGLLGGGGSILTVPVFVYVLGFDAKPAIAMSLGLVGVVSAFGMLAHWRAGNLNPRVALTFGSVATAGAYLGARLAVFFTGAQQLALFATVMLTAAAFMFRGAKPHPDERGDRTSRPMRAGVLVLEGITVGVFTGLVGVGGGFLVVPALVAVGRLPMKEAVGTSLAVIAMKSLAGFSGYLGQVEIPWAFMGGFTMAASLGIFAGSSLTRFVPARSLQRGFAAFLVIVGTFVLFENRHVFVPATTAAAPAGAHAATGARR